MCSPASTSLGSILLYPNRAEGKGDGKCDIAGRVKGKVLGGTAVTGAAVCTCPLTGGLIHLGEVTVILSDR